jgi:NifU-like protein involved in Fe-S cluster formation
MISDYDISHALDGLPSNRMHCAKLGRELIKSAIDDFFKKHRGQS